MKSVKPENIIIGSPAGTRQWTGAKEATAPTHNSHSDENIDDGSKVASGDHFAHILGDNFELAEARTVSDSFSPNQPG